MFVLYSLFIFSFTVDTCKKRWKYLRERYVQQKKVGDSPSYEHLSRPYLEKMKFLDNYIQPRKSYRHVGHMFTTPSMNLSLLDGNDSSKSSSSLQIANHGNGLEDSFPQQFYHHLNQLSQAQMIVKSEENEHEPEPPDPINKSLSDGGRIDGMHLQHHHNNMPSSSSSIVSQESPATIISHSTTTETDECGMVDGPKRRRSNSIINDNNNPLRNSSSSNSLNQNNHQKQQTLINNHNNSFDNDEHSSTNNDDTSGHHSPSVPPEFLYPYYQHSLNRMRKSSESVNLDSSAATFPTPSDFIHPFYSQAVARTVRNSEQLLGELVTSELLKMPRDRKKHVQKKILEILFFDD